MDNLDRQLGDILSKNQILKNEPMSKHTSFKIGGNADYYLIINNIDELKEVLELANKNKIPVTIVGNGTNLLVLDGGIRGFVIRLKLNDFKIKKTANKIDLVVESGLAVSTLASIASKEEIADLEFLSGIPGTVGGALRMNAGAFGHEMKDFVVKTRYMTYDGKIKTITNEEHKFTYRNSIFSKINAIILDTTLELKKGKKSEIDSKIKEYTLTRLEKQPLEYPSAGSTFKRMDGQITAKLIDDAGLKGYSIGDAEVSTKHAGFIINKGKATAKDVLDLVEHIKKVIKEKYNLDIELEVVVLGEEK